MAKDKIYLGDGAYAALEHGIIKVSTEDGISETNRVFLGVDELAALFKYAVEKGLLKP